VRVRRAGKREAWPWQLHEFTDLHRRVRNSAVADGRAVFLWAWDDVCLAHTKRRAVSIEEPSTPPSPQSAALAGIMLTSVAHNANESLDGLKGTVRSVLHGIPKGLKLAQLQSAFKDKTDEALDDVLATSLGFSNVDQMLAALPDAVRRDGDRYLAMREATQHEVTTLALLQNLKVREGVTYLLDEDGNISELLHSAASRCQLQEARPVAQPLSAYLPYDDSVVYEDLTEMQKIHLPSLLHNIEQRFLVEKIYTYIGNMLIAVNPYKTLSMPIPGCREPCGLYDDEVRAYYAKLRGNTRQKGVRAHVFVVADNAYRALGSEGQNQSVVISGESGAGKTKSAREVLRYIVQVSSGAFNSGAHDDGLAGVHAEQLVAKITQNNPLLEAFGNAKTLRNDNSSRFGKYLELSFDARAALVTGAQIQTYLLEKSRVIMQSRGERSFHIFYQMLAGLKDDAATAKALCLLPREQYRYLGAVDGTFVAADAYEGGVSEAEQWRLLQSAVVELGMDRDFLSMLRVLSLVLLLGNIEFVDVEQSGTSSARVSDATRHVLAHAASLLRCSTEALEEGITVKKEDKMFGRVPLNSSQAAKNCDSLAKCMYSELFNWLRDSINHELARSEADSADMPETLAGGAPTIGLLDIFGFESFAVLDKKSKTWVSANSLEQLCINFANESLQMLFNKKVLEADKALYSAEFEAGDVPDIQLDGRGQESLGVIDMVMTKLWDSCREAERRDEFDKMSRELVLNLRVARRDQFLGQHPKALQADQDKLWKHEERRFFPMPGTFVITHYADDVEYRADGMIEKNVDKCHDFLRTLVVSSDGQGGASLLREPLCLLLMRRGLGLEDDGRQDEEAGTGTGSRGRLRTEAGLFKKQLLGTDEAPAGRRKGLIPTLESTHMHFVRCLKPNDHKRPLLMERSKVAGQLSSNGVVEAVKLAQAAGLPTRYSYDELWDRKGMDLGVVLRAHWRRTGRKPGGALPPAREGMEQLLRGLAESEWLSEGAILSKPEDWKPFNNGAGSYKFGKTMLFLAAGRLGQLQLLRQVEMAPFAAILQAAVRRTVFVARYCVMSAKVREVRAAVRIQRWRRRWVLLQRKMKAAEAEARRRKQAELAAKAEAEKQRAAQAAAATAAAAAAEEQRRLREAGAAAAAAAREEERKRLEEERRMQEEEHRRIAEEKRLEAERLAREEEERRNRWPPDGYELVEVQLVRSRLADSTAPRGAPCGFGLQIDSDFPFEIQGMAAIGAAALSGKVAVGDKLAGVDGEMLKGKGIAEVRSKMAGAEGSAATLTLLRKEGVKPPPPDVNVLNPYRRKEATRIMIGSLSGVQSDDVSADACCVKLKGKHGLLQGMFVKLVLGGVPQTEPLQGTHKVIQVVGEDALIVEGTPPPGLEGRDLTPDLFSYPSYLVRVPAPFLLPARAGSSGVALEDKEQLTREESLGLEEFKPYASRAKARAQQGLRDIPEPLRHVDVTAQEFWRRNAPARNLAELYYPPFSWADFERSLRKEATGGDATLFGKFDFSETTGVASLKAALEELAGGQLPISPDGQAVVPPRVFATLVQQAATVPMPLAEEERGRYPAWLATYVPPVPQAAHDVLVKALPLLQFVLAPDPGAQASSEGRLKVALEVCEDGMRKAQEIARPLFPSRVVAVMGRRGTGKSFLCRKLLEAGVLARSKLSSVSQEPMLSDAYLPALGAKGGGGILSTCSEEGCTSGVLSYTTRLCMGDESGRGMRGYQLPVRVLDTEGESDAGDKPQRETPEAPGAWPAGIMQEEARLDLQQQRRDAVLVGIPRLAFLTCDVLVLVTSESLASQRFYARLLTWAQVASGSTYLGRKAPALIIVSNLMHFAKEEPDLDVPASTRAFFRLHERGGEVYTPVHLFGSANQKTQHTLRLGAFFREVSVVKIPIVPDTADTLSNTAAALASVANRQVARFQGEVYRLAASAQEGGVVGSEEQATGGAMSEVEWCALWRCAVPLWKDTHVSIADVRSQAECQKGALGASPQRNVTMEVARRAQQVFDLGNMTGDARRLNPCPGHQPPKRAMHLLHGVAASMAVKSLAVLCRQAQMTGALVDEEIALRSVLQHVGGALPCCAADPFPQGRGFDKDATACSKSRSEYEWAPYCHHRPITKEQAVRVGDSRTWPWRAPPGGDADTRRLAAKRIMGPGSMVGLVQLYTELETQEVTGASLVPIQIVMCTNLPWPAAPGTCGNSQELEDAAEQPKCEITTDKPHGFQAGYLVGMTIKGIDPRNTLHAGPKRLVQVSGLVAHPPPSPLRHALCILFARAGRTQEAGSWPRRADVC
jgi:tRNA A37 threonylcarbamoyladenosine biosynthesis protein TsaE